MPWRSTSAMEEKFSFINEWRSGLYPFRELCGAYGISHTLGYKYIKRWQEHGVAGLEELSRAPRHVPNKTPPHIEAAIVELRKKEKTWGAEKIITVLSERFPNDRWPAISTGNLILKRNGLIKPKRRIRRIIPVQPIFNPSAPNEIFSADFKGKFRMGNGVYCHPLTIVDSFSRYIFATKALHHHTFEASQPVFRSVFREYGMPKQMHTDNGAPFASALALGRLSRLSVWFIELGIDPVYSDPGHPEQNGRHERMHRDLKGEATRPPGYSLIPQQRKLNAFRKTYNEVRPHKALGNIPPARVHTPSPRRFPEKITEWVYPKQMVVRYVSKNSAIRWKSTQWVMTSTTLAGKHVGLEELDNGIWRVFFRQKLLGYLDERTLRIEDEYGRTRRDRL